MDSSFAYRRIFIEDQNNLMRNTCHAMEEIANSLKRANFLEAVKQAHESGYITDEYHKVMLNEILKKEGFEINLFKERGRVYNEKRSF